MPKILILNGIDLKVRINKTPNKAFAAERRKRAPAEKQVVLNKRGFDA